MISHFHQHHIANGKIELDFFTVLTILIYVIDKFLLNINIMNYLYIIYYIFIFYSISHSDMTKLHGAEHATFNTYSKNSNLDNIDEIINGNLIVSKCGVTAYVTNIIIFYFLSIFIDDFMIKYFLTNGLSVEIVRLIETRKFFSIVFHPVIILSGFSQKVFFTKRPDEIHVKMAIMAIRKLEVLEENYTD